MALLKKLETFTLEKTANSPRYCVYTVLMGRYETLNEQPALRDSSLPRICFTDNPDLQSDTWEIRVVPPTLPLDPIRSQRLIKAKPFDFLPGFDGSLYIDNSVILKAPPEVILEKLSPDGGCVFIRHSFRTSLQEEFFEVIDTGLDDSVRVFEQFNHYKVSATPELDGPVIWTGLIIRDHRVKNFGAFSEIWASHILRYSRRDQLSVTVALKQSALAHLTVALDNYDSTWHRWPVVSNKNQSRRTNAGGLLETDFRLENLRLKKVIDQLEADKQALNELVLAERAMSEQHAATLSAQAEELRQHIEVVKATFLGSTSWRVTRPLRWISEKVGRLRH